MKRKIGLREVEEFVLRERKTFQGGGGIKTFHSKILRNEEERKLVDTIMRRKLRENGKHTIKLRREKVLADKSLREALGGRTREYKKIIEDTKKNCEKFTEELKGKNRKKCDWLEDKYKMKYEVLDDLDEAECMKYGGAEILNKNCNMRGEELREPEVICGEDEVIVLTEEERKVLALGPKFCVRKNKLDEENFDIELEECIAKVKWEKMGRDEGKKVKDLADVAIMAILSDEEKEEIREWEEHQEARRRMVYDAEEKKWNFGRRRVTDLKGNNMVILPGKLKNFQDEANLELLRAELKHGFREYIRENCNEKGEIESNLDKDELRGIKSLKKRFKGEEIIILQTDKSGRFAVMSKENYLRAGNKHTSKDEEVTMNTIVRTQSELNGNISMVIKFCKMGHLWKHGDRIRSTMINKSLSVCPMYLTFKDHKGWSIKDGTVPPTRPIAGGNTGMNIHISEVVSEMVEPMVDAYEDGNEVISTEEFKAKVEILNEKNKNWNKWQWWEGITSLDGRFECCIKCPRSLPDEGMSPALAGEENITGNTGTGHKEHTLPWPKNYFTRGDTSESMNTEVVEVDNSQIVEGNTDIVEGYMNCEAKGVDEDIMESEVAKNKCICVDEAAQWKVDNWEKFWETEEGQDVSFWVGEEEKTHAQKTRITPSLMKKIRSEEWMKKMRLVDLVDMDKEWEGNEVLKEHIQDMEEKMILVGCDVEALYPSLDLKECGRIVEEEVMRTSIQWEDLDYLEGTRLIALNRSAEYCRSHGKLRGILPVRRKKTGSRPGVTGKGPLGAERGDQEQWKWPNVQLTEEDKRAIVAEVVKIVTEVMFDNHLYTFGGKTFRQKKGGPIGLRGTCAIARLVMCNWDRRWKQMMVHNNITITE